MSEPSTTLPDAPVPVRQHAASFFIIGTVLIDALAFALIMPVLPSLIMQLTGEGIGEAARWGGLATFVFALAQFLCSPVLGGLSDRFGRRPVLLMSLAALCLDFLLMGLAHALWVFFGARLLSGIFAATHSTATAYMTDITPAEKRAARFGWIGAAMGVGFVLGPAIGGLLGELSPRTPFFVAAALAGLNALFGFLAVPESLSLENRRAFSWKRANPVGTLTRLFRIENLGVTIGVYFFINLAGFVYPAVWAYAAIAKFGWSEAEIGASLAFYGVIYAVSQIVMVPYLLPRLGERRAIWMALCVEIVAFIALAFANAGWQVYAVISLALFTSIVPPALQKIMTERVSADEQGELQGGLSALGGVVLILSPLIFTQLFLAFESGAFGIRFPGAPFIVAAIFCAMGLTLFLARKKQRAPGETA
ncbi:TCR/Tet family MFS transporter [Hyphobacterium sp.]|uniref:TCR/Tet family MFS transporter n=1 Tax=Hyphobacterium sp. TaxID=2004662 RepID=UPI003B52B884